jgi:hypothetical protein
MITHKSKPFGPYSRFRVDVLETPTTLQAVGFDAAKSVEDGPAVAFCNTTPVPIPQGTTPRAKGGLLRFVEAEGRKLVEASPEWNEAQQESQE